MSVLTALLFAGFALSFRLCVGHARPMS